MKHIGEIIRNKRLSMGYSLEDVSSRAGLSFKTVFSIEHGKAISMLSLWAICRVLNLKVNINDIDMEGA